ncbi:hypothetical protein [Nitrospira tepida]|nr:hypothetical protein [Nitrospira tepida]
MTESKEEQAQRVPEGQPPAGRTDMEPLALLGVLAVVIGILGIIVLVKGRKKVR